MDATHRFCTHREWAKDGRVEQDNIGWYGASHRQTPPDGWKIGGHSCSRRAGTTVCGVSMAEAILMPAMQAWAEGMSLRATSRTCLGNGRIVKLQGPADSLHRIKVSKGQHQDFLTWFEYAPANSETFEQLVRTLRASAEWTYVERAIDIRLLR